MRYEYANKLGTKYYLNLENKQKNRRAKNSNL